MSSLLRGSLKITLKVPLTFKNCWNCSFLSLTTTSNLNSFLSLYLLNLKSDVVDLILSKVYTTRFQDVWFRKSEFVGMCSLVTVVKSIKIHISKLVFRKCLIGSMLCIKLAMIIKDRVWVFQVSTISNNLFLKAVLKLEFPTRYFIFG